MATFDFNYSGSSANTALLTGIWNDLLIRGRSRASQAVTLQDTADKVVNGMPLNPLVDSLALTDLDRVDSRLAHADARVASFDAGTPDFAGVVDGLQTDVLDRLSTDIEDFFVTYFPGLNAIYDKAVGAITAQLTTGHQASSAAAEDAQYRVMVEKAGRETERSAREVMDNYAALGYERPPGGMIEKLSQINEDAMRAAADGAGSIADEAAVRELTMTKSYVDRAAAVRTEAITLFSDYITRWLKLRLDQKLMEVGERDKYRRRLRGMFMSKQDAQAEAGEWVQKLRSRGFELDYQALSQFDKQNLQRVTKQFDAALARAEQISVTAATAFNALSGRASISGSD